MIKKLDKLIIKAFVGPFIATFLISLFVLVMQFFWLYIDDLVGKGLDVLTIFRLIGYVAATAVPLALPLSDTSVPRGRNPARHHGLSNT